MSVCQAQMEAEIQRIRVQSQPRHIVREILSQRNPTQNRAGEVARGIGPQFKSHYFTKKKKKKTNMYVTL
jgi:hypothetical protein